MKKNPETLFGQPLVDAADLMEAYGKKKAKKPPTRKYKDSPQLGRASRHYTAFLPKWASMNGDSVISPALAAVLLSQVRGGQDTTDWIKASLEIDAKSKKPLVPVFKMTAKNGASYRINDVLRACNPLTVDELWELSCVVLTVKPL